MEPIAVVTGAARGIGLAITRALLKDELTVVGVDVNEAGLSATAEKLTADGASFVPKLADLADPTQVARIFAEIEDTFGGVDALVNNAGTCFVNDFVDISPDELQRQMADKL